MTGLLFGLGLFTVCWVAHVAWWRTARPLATARALILLFGAGLLAALPLGPLILGWFGQVYDPAVHLHGLLVAGAVTAAYIATYPALEAISPTLTLLDDIEATGSAGLDRKTLFATMDDSVLLHPRIADLLNEGLVVLVGEHHCLTPKGRRVAGLFTGLRSLLRLSVGG